MLATVKVAIGFSVDHDNESIAFIVHTKKLLIGITGNSPFEKKFGLRDRAILTILVYPIMRADFPFWVGDVD